MLLCLKRKAQEFNPEFIVRFKFLFIIQNFFSSFLKYRNIFWTIASKIYGYDGSLKNLFLEMLFSTHSALHCSSIWAMEKMNESRLNFSKIWSSFHNFLNIQLNFIIFKLSLMPCKILPFHLFLSVLAQMHKTS